jgi:hypothetical protein
MPGIVGAVNDLDVSDWIMESFEAAKQTVYKTPIGAIELDS